MIRNEHIKWLMWPSILWLLTACGGGSGGGNEDAGRNVYRVQVENYCQDDSASLGGDNACPRPLPGDRYVDEGETVSFKVPVVSGQMVYVISRCPLRTQLQNSRAYSDPNFYGEKVVSGDLSGDTLSLAPVTASCLIELKYMPAIEISTDAGDHGSISPVRQSASFHSLTRFKVSADDGYVVASVDGCDGTGELKSDTYTLTNVEADCVLRVSYLEIPDMAGIWSGTWEGVDSAFGPVAGTWVTRMSQDNVRLGGPIEFSGDLDCAEGEMNGIADPRETTITGEVQRFPSPDPCPANSWAFRAFDDQATSASGTWTKSGLSKGAFEGRRIATLDGPAIQYFYPPWAGPGDYVTVVGEKLDMDLVNDSLSFGFGGLALVAESATESTIRLRLPGAAAGSEPLHLTTLEGTAMSPLPLNTEVTGPDTGYRNYINLGDNNSRPSGIVFSINNRRAFVANRGTGTVSMINTDQGIEFTSTAVVADGSLPVALHALAAHPNGRWIYAAGDGVTGILHAHTLELLDTLDLPAYGGNQGNPQGIAVSPDGRWLLLSEAAPGGRVSIVDIENDHTIVEALTMPAGAMPGAVAISPNNRHAFVAVSGSVNEILVYDLPGATTLPAIDIGGEPSTLAVSPDAGRLLVGDATAARVYWHDLSNGVTGLYTLAAGASPAALAITPDGRKVFVANDSNWLDVIDIATGMVIAVYADGSSSAIAISRDGRRAYASQPLQNRVVEIGNQRTLRISKQGGGLGTVRTSPVAINCGTACSATYSYATQVTLQYSVPTGFRFAGWSGDSDCLDGRVSMTANRYCVARFEKAAPPPPPPGGSTGGSSNCFIATAAYGSWLDPHVMSLRIFRDDYLLTNAVGTRLVEFYYAHSPPIADYIREREALRALVRAVLSVVVLAIEAPWLVGLGLWLALLLWLRARGLRARRALDNARVGDCLPSSRGGFG